MVKPLTFKGDKKTKKRKAAPSDDTDASISKEVAANHHGPEDDDSWVTADTPSDIAGPLIFVLPLAEPSCLACDASGKVFIHKLENLVEGDPLTAEPHDVRQVWIANRIVGTEKVSFKGHNGRYLGCDTKGVLSATTEAISPEESFLCVESSETLQAFSIQTQAQQYLTAHDDSIKYEVRGDASSTSTGTALHIRMQARFKPRFKESKESRSKEKISRKELEESVGRRLDEDEVRRLKKARVQGNFHEAILDARVKGKHDKYS
ncbi:MAG: hypothetical protein Q9190_006532 [Brigantiaea leucoxantha]